MMSYHFNNSLLQYEHTNSTDTYTIYNYFTHFRDQMKEVSS